MEVIDIPLDRATSRSFGGPDDNNNRAVDFVALPPADGGKQAWLFLAGCFMVEALTWGFPFAFGVFQSYYSQNELFGGGTNFAVIGTTQTGVVYLGSPVVFAIMQRWPQIRRLLCYFGLIIMSVSLILASFATSREGLILTQGLLYGIGANMLYSPTIVFVDEWFIRRKGFAFGIMWAGTGVAGVIFPVALEQGLTAFGFRTVLRAWALGVIILTAPLLYFIRPRLPIARSSQMRRLDFSFLRNRTFILFEAGNIIQGLGYFLPAIYLPTYASLLVNNQDASRTLTASLPLILFNISSVIGCIIMGSLSDRYDVAICTLVSAVGSTIAVLVLWGTATSLAQLYVFCLAYGIFAGSFSTCWSGMVRDVKEQSAFAVPGLVFSMLAAGRGVGSVISGPLASALLKGGETWNAHLGYGSGYGGIMVFVGFSALSAGVIYPGKLVGWV